MDIVPFDTKIQRLKNERCSKTKETGWLKNCPSHLFSVGHIAATEAVLCLENKEMIYTLIEKNTTK